MILIPLILGLIAWGLTFWSFFSSKGLALRCASWLTCAVALWFPIFAVHCWVEKNDLSSVMDCAWALTFAAGVLVGVNLVLHLAAWLIRRKRSK